MAETPDVPWGDDPAAFADSPLFREIQRVLSSSSGPVNWELARQIGVASAQEGREDPTPSDEDRRGLEDAVRLAELQVSRLTGLEPPADVAHVLPVRRAEWVAANTESLRDLIEPAAAKVGAAFGESSGDMLPPESEGLLGGVGAFVSQLSPLLLGAQVGTVLGALGQRVFGRYDIAVPRAGQDRLLFVVANIEAFEHDWSLPATEFRTAVALHEVTHRFEFARGWVRERFREVLEDFVSTLQIDIEGVRRRIEGIDAADPSAIESLMGSDEGLFGTVLDDEQRIKLGRVQAFMAAAEGFGDHVTHALGAELLPSFSMIEEALRRYHETEVGDPVFERLLGIDMKRELYVQGREFCDRVVDLTDEATLARIWESPDALPSLPEIEEPRLWLARNA